MTSDIIGKRFNKRVIIGQLDTNVWLARCDCGKITKGTYYQFKDSISCGCHKISKDPQGISFKVTWKGSYGDGNLSLDEFKILSQLNCFYCGTLPSNRGNAYRPISNSNKCRKETIDAGWIVYSGLDRMDSALPHNKNNVVPCCWTCNSAKGKLSIKEFFSQIEKCSSFRRERWNNSFLNFKLPEIVPFETPKKILNKCNKITYKEVKVGYRFYKLVIKEILPREKGSPQKYLCLCDCGRDKIASKQDLLQGKQGSCGDLFCKRRIPIEIGMAKSIHQANHKRYTEIPFKYFFPLIQMNCFYCNTPPSNCKKNRTSNLEEPFFYNGLDALYPDKGHYLENVVPCCWNCNRFKAALSLKDFDIWMTNVSSIISKNLEEEIKKVQKVINI